jgi:hypothetical protein
MCTLSLSDVYCRLLIIGADGGEGEDGATNKPEAAQLDGDALQMKEGEGGVMAALETSPEGAGGQDGVAAGDGDVDAGDQAGGGVGGEGSADVGGAAMDAGEGGAGDGKGEAVQGDGIAGADATAEATGALETDT